MRSAGLSPLAPVRFAVRMGDASAGSWGSWSGPLDLSLRWEEGGSRGTPIALPHRLTFQTRQQGGFATDVLSDTSPDCNEVSQNDRFRTQLPWSFGVPRELAEEGGTEGEVNVRLSGRGPLKA